MSGKTRGGRQRDGLRQREAAKKSAAGGLWKAVRGKYPVSVKRIVDHLDDDVTFVGVLQLEIAEFLRVKLASDAAYRKEDWRNYASLSSTLLQCRKHMRSLLEAMGPGGGANESEPTLPAAVERALRVVGGADLIGEDLVD